MRHAALLIAACLMPMLASAGHPGHGKGPADRAPSAASPARGFSDAEREDIESYFAKHPEKRRELPPGLAKKGKIPKGWRKKLAVGNTVPDDAWERRVPLPDDVRRKLPPLPEDVVLVRIEDRVVKVRERTREILGVLGL